MSALVVVRAVHFASCMVLVAVPAFSTWILPSDFFGSRMGAILQMQFRRVMAYAGAVALLSAIIGFWLVARTLAIETGVGTFPLLAQTHIGHLFLFRFVFIGAFLMALLNNWHWRWLLPTGACVLGSLAWAGHAVASGSILALVADTLHLLATGFWPGGLLPLAIYLAMVYRAETVTEIECMGRVVRRFSLLSLIVVGVLSASGIANACVLLPSFPVLCITTYGRLLLIKLIFFSAMIAFGAVNLLLLVPRAQHGGTRVLSRLRRNVAIELGLGIAVILIVGALGLTSPR